MMDTSVLIAGGIGFVGRALAQAFADSGVALASGASLAAHEQHRVIDAVREVLCD